MKSMAYSMKEPDIKTNKISITRIIELLGTIEEHEKLVKILEYNGFEYTIVNKKVLFDKNLVLSRFYVNDFIDILADYHYITNIF